MDLSYLRLNVLRGTEILFTRFTGTGRNVHHSADSVVVQTINYRPLDLLPPFHLALFIIRVALIITKWNLPAHHLNDVLERLAWFSGWHRDIRWLYNVQFKRVGICWPLPWYDGRLQSLVSIYEWNLEIINIHIYIFERRLSRDDN